LNSSSLNKSRDDELLEEAEQFQEIWQPHKKEKQINKLKIVYEVMNFF